MLGGRRGAMSIRGGQSRQLFTFTTPVIRAGGARLVGSRPSVIERSLRPPHTMPQQTRKNFHQQLAELEAQMLRTAALAGEAIAGATEAVLTGDVSVTEQVRSVDRLITLNCDQAEEVIGTLLARQQPTAQDLRLLLS